MLAAPTMEVRYATSDQRPQLHAALLDALISDPGVARVCEVGAGAQPFLSPNLVAERGLDYMCLDVSEGELAKAPRGYAKWVADIGSPDAALPPEPFDLVISKFVLEHVESPRLAHHNIRRLLRPGGAAVHLFPTLWDPAFVFNRLANDSLTEGLLLALQPRRQQAERGKFDAYYRWCRGPTRCQVARLESCGFVTEQYLGLFGHEYFKSIPRLQKAVDLLSAHLARHPIPWLTTFAVVVLRAEETGTFRPHPRIFGRLRRSDGPSAPR